MDNNSYYANRAISEATLGAAGLATALAAGASAACARRQEIQWEQRQAGIESRQRITGAKRSRNESLRRQIAALDSLIDSAKRK